MQPDYQVAIIGAGFGGLGKAIALKDRGQHAFVVLEKENDVGGCWRDNTYPGAACDVPSHLYSFSFEKKFDWSRRFAPQAEILAYLRHCADKYRLHPHIRFGTSVNGARFDEASGLWHLDTSNGPITARALITATGQLNRPAWPNLPGRDRFAGETFHSARWNHDVDLTGKTVAVIGTGASAIQFVPEIAKQAKQVLLFQRSAPYVIPKPDRPYSATEQRLMARFPLLQKLDRARVYAQNEARVLGFTSLQGAMRFHEYLFKKHLRECVPDPDTRAKLTPDYPMGCKRILISNDYYQALTKYRIPVITGGVRAITADGVEDTDGEHHQADVIIYGTGFQATDFLAPMTITGRRRSLPGHHRARLPQPVHAVRPQHQPGPQLDHLYDRVTDRLCGQRPGNPGTGRPPLRGCAPRRTGRFQPPAAGAHARYRLGPGLRELVQDRQRQEHQQLAGLYLQLPATHPTPGPGRL